MTHALYVASAYGISALMLGGLFGWLLLDSQARRRELRETEARGMRRRSGPEQAR